MGQLTSKSEATYHRIIVQKETYTEQWPVGLVTKSWFLEIAVETLSRVFLFHREFWREGFEPSKTGAVKTILSVCQASYILKL